MSYRYQHLDLESAKYPEHEKLAVISDESHAIGHFLEDCGYRLCELKSLKDIRPCYRCGATGERRRGVDCPTCDGTGDIEVELNDAWYPVQVPVQRILAEHFEIDYDKLMAEKDAMLAEIREAG